MSRMSNIMGTAPRAYNDSIEFGAAILRAIGKVSKSIRPWIGVLCIEESRNISHQIKCAFDAKTPYLKIMHLEAARDFTMRCSRDMEIIMKSGTTSDTPRLVDAIKIGGSILTQLEAWYKSLAKKYDILKYMSYSPAMHPTLEMMFPSSQYFQVRTDLLKSYIEMVVKDTNPDEHFDIFKDYGRVMMYEDQEAKKAQENIFSMNPDHVNEPKSIPNFEAMMDPNLTNMNAQAHNKTAIVDKIITLIRENPDHMTGEEIRELVGEYVNSANMSVLIDMCIKNPFMFRNFLLYMSTQLNEASLQHVFNPKVFAANALINDLNRISQSMKDTYVQQECASLQKKIDESTLMKMHTVKYKNQQHKNMDASSAQQL